MTEVTGGPNDGNSGALRVAPREKTRGKERLGLHRDRAGELFNDFQAIYQRTGQSLEVDFRALLPEIAAKDRATHLLHPYPAKLLRHIPALALAAPQLSSPGGLVFDPFCGSGTTLVEAFLAEHPAVGLDVNPLAVLLSRVKTSPIDEHLATDQLAGVVSKARSRRARSPEIPDRLEYWFHAKQLRQLCYLRDSIHRVEEPQVQAAFQLALSATAREVSLANPRVSVPVRLKPEVYPEGHELRKRLTARLREVETIDVIARFSLIADRTIRGIARLAGQDVHPRVSVECGDARFDDQSPAAGSVDLVVTSPPYLGAQKYIRATSLNMLCLDLADDSRLKQLQRISVGREFFRKEEYSDETISGIAQADSVIDRCRAKNPLRAHLAVEYLRDMRLCIDTMTSTIRNDGVLVLVAGGNHLCEEPFDTPAYLATLCQEAGLRLELELVDTIRSRGLMTRRNREASPIATERVLVFRK